MRYIRFTLHIEAYEITVNINYLLLTGYAWYKLLLWLLISVILLELKI
jgi:hypothetical protein